MANIKEIQIGGEIIFLPQGEKQALVFLNEQHKLLPIQVDLLNKNFGEGNWGIFPIPAEGLSLQDIKNILAISRSARVVLASPVPALLAGFASLAGQGEGHVWIFHNEFREAIEVEGRIIHGLHPKGWELVNVRTLV